MATGLVVVGRDAAAAGTTSLPTPLSNLHADWYWWQYVLPDPMANEDAAGTFSSLRTLVHAEVRSMRKVMERDEVPVIVFETASGNANIGVNGAVSTLLLRS